MIPAAAFAGLFLALGPAASCADRVTLRDGTAILGQAVEPAPRGKVLLIVRRDWAAKAEPRRLKDWEAAGARWVKPARDQRRRRLEDWQRERARAAMPGDPVSGWIEAELKGLREPNPPKTPLLFILLDHAQVRAVQKGPADSQRMLRQAWKAGLADPESKPADALKSWLEGRGFAMSDVDPARIDSLLPIPPESDMEWLARRAATEVANDPGLRFLAYQGLVLAEPKPGEAPALASLAGDAIGALLGEQPHDPLAPKLAGLAGHGKVGAVVTSLEIGDDLSQVRVETALWVRTGDRWRPVVRRPVIVRAEAVAAEEAKPIENDPQVQEIFRLLEGVGLGQAGGDVKARSLRIGAATRQALGRAQSALNEDLESLALPVGRDRPPGG